jgi:hypothetical protein
MRAIKLSLSEASSDHSLVQQHPCPNAPPLRGQSTIILNVSTQILILQQLNTGKGCLRGLMPLEC